MKLAVLSDTHGHLEPTRKALDLIRLRDVDFVIHCGDVGGGHLIELFADWPAHFVFGNVDQDRDSLRRTIESAGQHCHGVFGERHLEGRRIAFLHGDDARRLRETALSGEWDLVCYGHTHRNETHKEGETVVLNPGALYRARPRTIALVELPSLEIEFVPVL
jgi:uncharacterized protein